MILRSVFASLRAHLRRIYDSPLMEQNVLRTFKESLPQAEQASAMADIANYYDFGERGLWHAAPSHLACIMSGVWTTGGDIAPTTQV
jgi:hypothetical protein